MQTAKKENRRIGKPSMFKQNDAEQTKVKHRLR